MDAEALESETFPVKAYMIESMTRSESAGYVPLCSVLLWIMTNGGVEEKDLLDSVCWGQAVGRLLPLLSTGQVEIIGTPDHGGAPAVIAGITFAGILVGEPLRDSLALLVADAPWIGVHPFIDQEHWERGFNDQLFVRRAAPAAWTHLQVRKSAVLAKISLPLPKQVSKGRRGAPRQYDLSDVEQFVIQQLDKRGDFDSPIDQVKGWRSQNDLVRELQKYMATPRGGGREPSDSHAKTMVATATAKWRAAKKSKD